MNKQENSKLEFKQDASSSSYLKTVSAYANYDGGNIEFGRTDDGSIIGLDDPKQTCLSIENQINDAIQPVPHFELAINPTTKVVTLHVKAGESKPYLYRNKAYKRSDTSTIAVDRVEFQRLILEGMNKNYEELPAINQELHFTYLEQRLIEKLNIKSLNLDILKTLELYTDKNGFNHAAVLLSDDNRSPGIDIARMGDTIDIFHERHILKDISILEQYDQALEFIHKQYRYEQVVGGRRERVETIPLKAIREALANAVVHRVWDINAPIRVLLYKDRLEITSPGGLPVGLSELEYLQGQITLLRNPIIAGVFYKLDIIEQFGTGILRIMQAYKDSFVKPGFRIYPNTITVVLPLLRDSSSLEADEREVYDLLIENIELSRPDIEHQLGISKAKAIRLLNELIEKNAIERVGSGRGTVYRVL